MTSTVQTRPRTNKDLEPQPIRPKPSKKLLWPVAFYRTSVGKKWVMALTGIALMGFVLVHMIGNLKMYLGAEQINHYGEFLRDMGEPIFPRTVLLWIMRIGLIGAFALHIHAAYSLTVQNRKARAKGFQYKSKRDYIAANFASRTMRWTGIIVLLFLFWHLADLTWGWFNPDFVRGDVYNNVNASLSRWPVTILYIVANLALGAHLAHGAWSIFQSLGVNNPKYNQARKWFAIAFAAIIVVGNVSFPLAVQLGVVGS